MAPQSDTSGQCRIGLLSRVDFPSEGYRRGLLLQAVDIFARQDVHFIIIAGGLIAERHVREKTRKLTQRIKQLEKQIKALEKADDPATAPEIRKLAAKANRFREFLEELTAEKMAEQLAAQLPTFKNAKGETVNVYVFPSPTYDGDVGAQVCQLLADLRKEDIRIYHSEDDVIAVRQAQKTLEVVVPVKSPWRGDYYSTPAERALKDRMKHSASDQADLYVVGCFGSSINKQRGEIAWPYVTVPVIHNLQGVRVNENQVGVAILTMSRDRPDPIFRVEPLKDMINGERKTIVLPRNLPARRRRLVELIREEGRTSTGVLASKTRLSASTVMRELEPLDNRERGRRPSNWPGLRYDEEARRWDFDNYWMRENHRYPDLPKPEARQVDSIVAYGCLHAGCIYTDYGYFLKEVPRVMLQMGATTLVGAGDFVEGIKHPDDVYGGLNVTQQEMFAGALIASINVDVFRGRFEEALARSGRHPSPEAVVQLVNASLVMNPLIPGNHDLWSLKDGHTPLVVMTMTAIDRIYADVSAILEAKKLACPNLLDLIKAKFVVFSVGSGDRVARISRGQYVLPSGLKMTILHPWMARAQTTSIRPQQMLQMGKDSQIVIGANFHVSEFVGEWKPQLGQRVCVEVGTMKTHSNFEDNKLKVVDHGFTYLRVESHEGRIIATDNTFFTGRSDPEELSRGTVFRDLLTALGLKA